MFQTAEADMPSPKLEEAQVLEALQGVPEWGLAGESIQRTYRLRDFADAMRFVGRVAQAAEDARHHPDILIRWNKVTLTLTTHDSGGITLEDFALAKQCDALAATFPSPDAPAPAAPKAPKPARAPKKKV